ncbi:MAG TPA: DegQ family serine endoprotease [Pirellulaceae bacterium]|nr:DegQ family serine endoprotease [Pirellulaceae bacterium]HMO90767.1 DegQ family serine endoprotease [Pirellulaceae bacterium]HMP68018.1 DegQ family serine endoprotease [Pirellulaceae bacterium]
MFLFQKSKCQLVFSVVFSVALIGGSCFAVANWVLPKSGYQQEIEKADRAFQALQAAADLSVAFQHVAVALRPSVVSISSETRVVVTAPQMQRPRLPFDLRPFFDDRELEDFFRFDIPEREQRSRGIGSGVIIQENGYILTNHHVIRNAEKIQVTLSDNRIFDAEVVGTDQETDLAVLKIATTGLKPVKWGDSDAAKVGEWVVAIGSPFGLSQTVTAGIISAVGRDAVGISSYENFLQTDAAINPGNSGGPLVNLQGELLGINTAIASRSGSFQGVGFAIPSSMARRVVDKLIRHGEVQRGFLGIGIQDLTEELAESFQFTGKPGVLVGEIVGGGPADRAGLKEGDIITSINGRNFSNANQLRNYVADLEPGSRYALEYFRDGKLQQSEVEVGLRNVDMIAGRGRSLPPGAQQQSELGVIVQPLDPDLAAQLKLRDDKGVLVTEVEASGLAARLGIKAGDVILSVNGEVVDSPEAFNQHVRDADMSQGIRIHLYSNGSYRFVFLRQ